jgi:DNA-directed RNA polymerase III subunit RPC8
MYAGNDMHMYQGSQVMLRVSDVRFHKPPTPHQQETATGDDKLLGTEARPFVPMKVVGDVNGDGLGLLSWWGGGDEGEEAAGGEAGGEMHE